MQYRGTLALHDLDAAEFDKIVQKSGTTWNGTANPPAYLKSQLNGGFGPRDIKTGRIGNWMCIHNGYPSTTNYVPIKENLPDTTRELFCFCRKNRLLRGAIQFLIYYQDPQYAAFIDARAEVYLHKLVKTKSFWDVNQHETDEYQTLQDDIHYETILFFSERDRAGQEQIMDTINTVLGRFERIHENGNYNNEEREGKENKSRKKDR